MQFTSANVRLHNTLPHGQPERDERTLNMVASMAREAFGSCSNHAECEAACPKAIPLEFIAGLNRDLIRAAFHRRRLPLAVVGMPRHPAHDDT
jgi:succinate dehydrogenase / fumarate reductase iron-sulfur subunit